MLRLPVLNSLRFDKYVWFIAQGKSIYKSLRGFFTPLNLLHFFFLCPHFFRWPLRWTVNSTDFIYTPSLVNTFDYSSGKDSERQLLIALLQHSPLAEGPRSSQSNTNLKEILIWIILSSSPLPYRIPMKVLSFRFASPFLHFSFLVWWKVGGVGPVQLILFF